MTVKLVKNIKIVSGWFGGGGAEEFFRDYDHPSTGLNVYLQKLICELRDLKSNEEIEIHFNTQFTFSKNKKYLILLEHPSIRPQNYFLKPWAYSKIFSWDARLGHLDNFIYVRYPHDPYFGSTKDQKNIRYSMVCSNRNLLIGKKENSLYNKRQAVIEYVKHAKIPDFYLYGSGWNMRNMRVGLTDRIAMFLHKKSLISVERPIKLPFYRGHLDDKTDLLRKSVFNFCFENIAVYPGYISEKIWDSIFAGSIPVYWPAWEIPDEELPRDLYINASKYRSISELFEYLEKITENEIKEWRMKLEVFAQKQKEKISVRRYVDTIVGQISKDLK